MAAAEAAGASGTPEGLVRNSSNRTFASEDEDDARGFPLVVKDYNDVDSGAVGSRFPVIGGSQNLNNTSPPRMSNVLNHSNYEYSNSPNRNNESPVRRIGGGLRDLNGDAFRDRTNRRAADQAAYAAALQEQIAEKKRSGSSKLGKNEEYRFIDEDDDKSPALPYHTSPPPRRRNPFGSPGEPTTPDRPANNVLGRAGRTFAKNHHHNHSIEIGDNSSPMAAAFNNLDRYDGGIEPPSPTHRSPANRDGSPTKAGKARGSNDPNAGSQIMFGDDGDESGASVYDRLKKDVTKGDNPFGKGGAVSRSPSHSPGKARQLLVNDVYGDGSGKGAVVGFDPTQEKAQSLSKQWRPSVRQVTSRERAATKTQKQILEEQIAEVRDRKEREKREELEIEARDERRVRAELAVLGVRDQQELAKKKAQAVEGMQEMQRMQEEQISQVLARKGRLGKKDLVPSKVVHHIKNRPPPKAKLDGKNSPRVQGADASYDPSAYIPSDGTGPGPALAFPLTYEESRRADSQRPRTADMGPALASISQLTNAAMAPMGSKFLMENGLGMNRVPSEEQFDSYLVNWQREMKDPRVAAGAIPRLQPPNESMPAVSEATEAYVPETTHKAVPEEKEFALPIASSRLIPTNPFDGNDGIAGSSLLSILGEGGMVSVGFSGGNSVSVLTKTLEAERQKQAEYMNNIGSNTTILENTLHGEAKQAFLNAKPPIQSKVPDDDPEYFQKKLSAMKQRIKDIGNSGTGRKEKPIFNNIATSKDPWEKPLVPLYTQLSPEQQREAIMQAPIFVRAHALEPNPKAMSPGDPRLIPASRIASKEATHIHGMEEPILTHHVQLDTYNSEPQSATANAERSSPKRATKGSVIKQTPPHKRSEAQISPALEQAEKEALKKKMDEQIEMYARANGLVPDAAEPVQAVSTRQKLAEPSPRREKTPRQVDEEDDNEEMSYDGRVRQADQNNFVEVSAQQAQDSNNDADEELPYEDEGEGPYYDKNGQEEDANEAPADNAQEQNKQENLPFNDADGVGDVYDDWQQSNGDGEGGEPYDDGGEPYDDGQSYRETYIAPADSPPSGDALVQGDFAADGLDAVENDDMQDNGKDEEQDISRSRSARSPVIDAPGLGEGVSNPTIRGSSAGNAYTSDDFMDSGENSRIDDTQANAQYPPSNVTYEDGDDEYYDESRGDGYDDSRGNTEYDESRGDPVDDARVLPAIIPPISGGEYDEGYDVDEGENYEDDFNFKPSTGLEAPDQEESYPADDNIGEDLYASNPQSARGLVLQRDTSTPGEVDEDEDEIPDDEELDADYEDAALNQGSVGEKYVDDFISKPNSLAQLGIEIDADEVDDEDEDEKDNAFVGVITFKLVSGANIAPKSTLFEGKCDPYVVLSLGAQQVETQRIDNTVNPVWNERVLLSWDGFSVLHAQVNDYNEPPVKHEFLGEAYIDLEELQLQPDLTRNVNISLEGAASGTLQFEITLRSG